MRNYDSSRKGGRKDSNGSLIPMIKITEYIYPRPFDGLVAYIYVSYLNTHNLCN